jgi:putative acetyltransferase
MAEHVIVTANSAEHFRQARLLFEDYQRWLGIDLCFQNFTGELETLVEMYGPPKGLLLLATVDGEYVGCVGLRWLEDQIAEMKRMYVLEKYRGLGIGKALSDEFISRARAIGYAKVRLDTIPRLGVALAIYKKMGFAVIAPYRHNPDPEVVYLELQL